MPPVHLAARQNDVEELARLLDEEPGLVEADSGGGTPLIHAITAGSVAAARLLIQRGADVRRAVLGYSPLMWACCVGLVELLELLLDQGADPSVRGKGGETALMSSAYGHEIDGSDHVAVIRMLLEGGRVPVDARSQGDETAVWWACNHGYSERLRVLLMEGHADHTIADDQGEAPMDVARRRGHMSCIHVLQWFEGELHRSFLLSKARAVVDATESISKAPEKVGGKTRGEAQRAREEAAPAWLRGRVGRGEALPSVEVVVDRRGREGNEEEKEEDERGAVLEYAVGEMPEDLYVEMMEGLRLR